MCLTMRTLTECPNGGKFVLLNNSGYSINTFFFIFHYFSVLKYSKNTSFRPFILNQILQSKFISKKSKRKWLGPITSQSDMSPYWKINAIHLSDNLSCQCSRLGERPCSESKKGKCLIIARLVKGTSDR